MIAEEGVETGDDWGAVTFSSVVAVVTSVCKGAKLTITAAEESVAGTPPTATAVESNGVVPTNVSAAAVDVGEAGNADDGGSETTLPVAPQATLISSSIAPKTENINVVLENPIRSPVMTESCKHYASHA